GNLYGTRLEGWLREHGVSVRLTTGVREVVPDEDDATGGGVPRSGGRLAAAFVVLARPFDPVANLIPPVFLDLMSTIADVGSMQASPITGVHLWFDRPVCPFDHVVTPGRLIQWVFNHTAIQGRTVPEPASDSRETDCGAGQYLQIVISASYDLLALDKLTIR